MKTFKVNRNIKLEAENYKNRNSWGHKAYLYIGGEMVDETKIRYYNRTWERYTYEGVLEKLAEESKALSDYQRKVVKKFIKNHNRVEDDLKPLRMVGAVAKMGEVLATAQKAKNDWKTRMLKAGLGNKGLIMPKNWGELSEDEKEKRLNKVINHLDN